VSVASRAESDSGRTRRRTPFRVFSLACAALVAWGAYVRHENYVSADFGLGYALGFLGTACMVLLLLYSVRKRLAAIAGWGPLRYWFGIHMLLGILGPVAILFHSNFQLGSLNSSVALVCMLLVASSGVVGRLIYPKIHHGLYGRRASLRELQQSATAQRSALAAKLAAAPGLGRELAHFDALALRDAGGALAALTRFVRLARQARALRQIASSQHFSTGASASLSDYVSAARRVAGFTVYERLFALWHAFHLPICFLMFTAVIVHVITAHMY
jgi:hypothetical protein